jgi:hypothetical protein
MQTYRPTNWDDVYFVVDNMRDEDIEECMACGRTALDALSRSFEVSEVTYTLMSPDGHPAAILGVTDGPLGEHFGIVWMLGTNDIKKHKMHFLRACKAGLDSLFAECGKEALYNYTYANNSLHHVWLRWLGFTFLRQVELPPYGHSFYEFVRLRG